ncbi:MAG: Phosphofructokinase (pyrophosphate-based) [Streblomastix strix]|uniref:Phosphofructokinase (Pyrophosphate-based) n=1 Tax=Streblomastix strix TaxID=222440 RepID=A0A5J4VG19_9EUKA|nr:MAG: Phosphofructokinase (pyrophosphate-based) [Streblomastix strix]
MATLEEDLLNLTPAQFVVKDLGERKFTPAQKQSEIIDDKARVLAQTKFTDPAQINPQLAWELAGQREKIFFDPAETTVGVVNCGGLCPGLNDVIRAVTYAALNHGVKRVIGFKYGWAGMAQETQTYVTLNYTNVNTIHMLGGSFLGSSRGPVPVPTIVETLKELHINIVICIGGDGTQRGSMELQEEIELQGLKISVIGIPKTIDNDIKFITRTFGFDTAVEKAREAIASANAEASSAQHGIGLVRLMGRDSGFIAAKATLASGDVNICLVPEEKFTIPNLMAAIKMRLLRRDHCVIVVAEGAGTELLAASSGGPIKDKSGNVSFGDIGPFLKNEITKYFKEQNMEITMKYIDPSYMIRSCVPTAADAAFCEELGNKAIDSAISGKTGSIVGFWNEHFTLVPFRTIHRGRKKIELNGNLWGTVKKMTVDVLNPDL